MFEQIKKLFKPKQCIICKQKPQAPRKYYSDWGEEVLVCEKCVPYAERRALRKKV